jgi:ribosome-binding ATPase YchF (GTP1/OBG family)
MQRKKILKLSYVVLISTSSPGSSMPKSSKNISLSSSSNVAISLLYIANVGEDEIGDEDNDKVKAIREYAAKEDSEVNLINHMLF